MDSTVHQLEIKSIEQLENKSALLANWIQHPIVILKGELGAGKTTIIKALIKMLGSKDQGSSPSYALINKYTSPVGPIFHLDLYRLNSIEEIYQLGIEEIFDQASYCFIEWPERIEEFLPKPHHLINIKVKEDDSRSLVLTTKF